MVLHVEVSKMQKNSGFYKPSSVLWEIYGHGQGNKEEDMVYKDRRVWRGIENALVKSRFNYISLLLIILCLNSCALLMIKTICFEKE